MLITLENMIKYGSVLKLLEDYTLWDSLIVNRRKPHTYRVFTKLQDLDLRVCLHKFEICDLEESFAHPHPWPGAFFILEGSYKMSIGLSQDRFNFPVDVADFVMNKGSMYEITNPLTWHAVTPRELTYTIMINGPAWPEDIAHTKVRTTKGKDLDKMPEKELREHLDKFKCLLKTYFQD